MLLVIYLSLPEENYLFANHRETLGWFIPSHLDGFKNLSILWISFILFQHFSTPRRVLLQLWFKIGLIRKESINIGWLEIDSEILQNYEDK